MKQKRIPEVLSPAGDMARLRAALDFGADAVYIAGKQFGMRASPDNFDDAEIQVAAELCHKKGKRLYVTCNTLPRNHELPMLPAFLEHCGAAGVDAFIIADIGILELAKRHAPQVDLHISTQAGITNYAAANAFYALGAKRVVLARELSIEEIRTLRSNTPDDLEIEAFVHGAMCMSVSGRCLLSNYMTGRDANRGACAQPCRWAYHVTELQRPNTHFTVESNETGSYIFNSRDMCLISHLPMLHAAGISSFKIEGRAKSEYYVASVTSAYRRAVDFYAAHPNEPLPDSILAETEKTSHRAYSHGFYFGEEPGQTIESGGYIRSYDVIAVAIGSENGMVRLKQRNKFLKGAIADVLVPGAEPFTVPLEEIFDQYLQPIDSAPHAEMTVYLKTDALIPAGSFLRVKRD